MANKEFLFDASSPYHNDIYNIAVDIANDLNLKNVTAVYLDVNSDGATIKYADLMGASNMLPFMPGAPSIGIGGFPGMTTEPSDAHDVQQGGNDGDVSFNQGGGIGDKFLSAISGGMNFADNHAGLTAGIVVAGKDIIANMMKPDPSTNPEDAQAHPENYKKSMGSMAFDIAGAAIISSITGNPGAGVGWGVTDGFWSSILGGVGGGVGWSATEALVNNARTSSYYYQKLVKKAEASIDPAMAMQIQEKATPILEQLQQPNADVNSLLEQLHQVVGDDLYQSIMQANQSGQDQLQSQMAELQKDPEKLKQVANGLNKQEQDINKQKQQANSQQTSTGQLNNQEQQPQQDPSTMNTQNQNGYAPGSENPGSAAAGITPAASSNTDGYGKAASVTNPFRNMLKGLK